MQPSYFSAMLITADPAVYLKSRSFKSSFIKLISWFFSIAPWAILSELLPRCFRLGLLLRLGSADRSIVQQLQLTEPRMFVKVRRA